ncbi:MAG: TetR/AcrR family transcriptional regulator [Candidatus Omnitrophica bacterium]|nr:TetR/AcrR family transcriptional regulator [Candidatus Omnitrophota bacterium]
MAAFNRKERDRLLRQSDILKAAEHVFATKGYHKATIQDIARQAQYAVGTIYLYFKDKEVLYLNLIERKIADLISEVKKEVNKTEDAKEKIKVLVRQQLAYFEGNQDFFRIYFSERGGLRWAIKDKISKSAVDKFVKYIDYITELLRDAQEKLLIRKDLDIKRLAYVLASMLNAVIIPWLKGACKKERITDMTDFILDIFFKGVEQKQ